MIARTWHGTVRAQDADRYSDYLGHTGVPDLRGTPGNRGVFVLRRIENGQAHFSVLSLWRSLRDIQAFAGEDVTRARYYPRDAEFLLEMVPRATHFEVLTGADLFPSKEGGEGEP